jgi:hypothetical protein
VTRALAVLLLSAAMAQPPASAPDAGVPLFNGRDLSGWHNIN